MSPDVDVTFLSSTRIPSGAVSKSDLKALCAFTLGAEKVAGPVELSLEFTGHDRIHQLNRHFRGVDRTTDVISFRYTPRPELTGDIAINVVQAALQAKKMRHSLAREIRLLWIHGMLHLLDYTDYKPVPRRRMFKRQNTLLRRWEKKAGKR